MPFGKAKRGTGRPDYPAQTLFRALLLGFWYNLSDVKLSAQLARDLLFRKFCRLELDQGVPDATPLGRFRVQLGDRLKGILSEVVTQLEEVRVILAEGRVSIVDGEGANAMGSRECLNVVEAAQSRISTADPEAGNSVKVNAKGKKLARWGWQAFVNADEDGFIRRTAVSPGNEAEVDSLFDGLVVGDKTALYADAAYSGPRTRALVARNDMLDQVQRRGARDHPLSDADKACNDEIGVTRGRVEAIFGHWKRNWGLWRTRFMGRTQAGTLIALAAISWNLQKGARFKNLYG